MIILMGMPGSGKSTQAEMLAKFLRRPWLSTGKLLRGKNDSQYNATMVKGNLVDDESMFELVEAKLGEYQWHEKEVVLEGFPRNIAQAEWLTSKVKAGQTFITSIIHIDVPKDKVLQRLMARGRPDDSEAAIVRRFEEYEARILPVLDYFTEQGFAVQKIDGSVGIEDVHSGIKASLQS